MFYVELSKFNGFLCLVNLVSCISSRIDIWFRRFIQNFVNFYKKCPVCESDLNAFLYMSADIRISDALPSTPYSIFSLKLMTINGVIASQELLLTQSDIF